MSFISFSASFKMFNVRKLDCTHLDWLVKELMYYFGPVVKLLGETSNLHNYNIIFIFFLNVTTAVKIVFSS